MPSRYEKHQPHGSMPRPHAAKIKHCVTFHCSECGAEILGWVPGFAAHPERLGWCDACWEKQHGSHEHRRAA
jgi:hypothetical protein